MIDAGADLLKNSAYMYRLLLGHKASLDHLREESKHRVFFELRESGNNFSRYKLWNQRIIVDSSSNFLNNFIKDRSPCGKSLMVFPSRRYIKIKTDPHSEMLYLREREITTILQAQYVADSIYMKSFDTN